MLAAHLVPGYFAAAKSQSTWKSEWTGKQRTFLWAVALGSTVAPDIDVVRNVLFRGFLNHSVLWTHSIFVYLGLGLLWLILHSLEHRPFLKTAVGLATVGGFSHLILDIVAHGTPLLYPVSMMTFGIAPARVVEGGFSAYITDPIFLLEALFFSIAIIHWAHHQNITPRFKRQILATTTSGLILFAVAFILLCAASCQSTSPTPTDDASPLSPAWTATGERSGSHFGYAVGSAGDVNGDGYDDVVVGADRYVAFTGRAYVYAGSASGLSASPILTATGEDVNNHFGYAVGAAGDVNGDGYDDVVVGAYHYRNFHGRVYVYAGSAGGLSARPTFTATGEGPENYFGRSVGGGGDVNGDGYDDVVVGAQAFDDNTGRVYVFAGGPQGLSAEPMFAVSGEGPSNAFGQSVGIAGDVNGDGYADVIVGAHGFGGGTGRAYVYVGSANGPDANPTFIATGESRGDRFGYAVGAAGDVNGDGLNDVVVGAFGFKSDTGQVYVYAGGKNGLNASPIFSATGKGPDSWLGRSVGAAGDVNGDGYGDLIVGAQNYGDNVGRAYVYAGGASGLSVSPIFTATGESANDWLGKSVGTAGDVNGDGFDDVVVGVYGYRDWTGRAYVYTGNGD